MDWIVRRWVGVASYEPRTLAYWVPRLCVVTVFHLAQYIAVVYFLGNDRPRKTSRVVPCVERDGRISEKISSVPFEPEKPPSVDPVESGDLITWVDEEQSKPK